MKILLVWFLALFSLPLWAEAIGMVSVSVGDVYWSRAGSDVRLQRGDAVHSGDRVVTAAQARVVLRMNEGSTITLGGQTEFRFHHWQYQTGASTNEARLELVEGAFRFVTGLITRQAEPQLTVQTPAATLGIRGTDFWGGYLQPEVLDVLLLDSEHALEVRNGQGQVLIQASGQGVSVQPGQAPSQPVRWSDEKRQRAVATVSLP